MSALGSNMHYLSGAVGSFQMSHIAAAVGIRPMEVAVTIPASGGVTVMPTNMPEANNTAIRVNWPYSSRHRSQVLRLVYLDTHPNGGRRCNSDPRRIQVPPVQAGQVPGERDISGSR